MDREGFRKFFEEFMSESDRAALVLGVAQMDELLREILEKRLIDAKKSLFDFNGPFGTFSARIDSAYVTGVIDKDLKSKLHMIRKIRNECAHNIEGVDFSSQSISQRVQELAAAFSNKKIWNERLPQVEETFSISGNSLVLRFAVSLLVKVLVEIREQVVEIQNEEIMGILSENA